MSKYHTLKNQISRESSHLKRLKRIYRQTYKNKPDVLLQHALKKRQVELDLLRLEVDYYIESS